MRNTKEIEAILISIYALNQCSEHKDKNIAQLIDYAFRRIYSANTNLITLACVGKSYRTITEEIQEVLDKETKFRDYDYLIIP